MKLGAKLSEKYRKLSRREKTILYGTTAALLFLFVDRLVVAPIHEKLSSVDRAIRDEETAIKKSLHVLVQKNRIAAENREFMAYSVDGKNPEEEMTSLLKEMESLADRASVSLIYVKPANVESDRGITKHMATLECESQMEQIAGFFHSIESSTKLLKIEKFEIQPKNRESSLARCSMTVSKTVVG